MPNDPAGWLAEYAEWMAECWSRDVCDDEWIDDERQEELQL